jgi:hypothetical protein
MEGKRRREAKAKSGLCSAEVSEFQSRGILLRIFGISMKFSKIKKGHLL